MKHLAVLVALIVAINFYTSQHIVKISPGFFTAKDYLDMSDTERRAYITGQINGMLVAPFFGAPEANLEWLKTCSARMSDEELASLLTRYIRDRPNQQQNLNVVTFNALREACRQQ